MTADRIVGEWRQKVDSLSLELDISQKETRNTSAELFRVKNAYEEALLQLDDVRRENKNLSNEIRDLMDQVCLCIMFSCDTPLSKISQNFEK